VVFFLQQLTRLLKNELAVTAGENNIAVQEICRLVLLNKGQYKYGTVVFFLQQVMRLFYQ
jgi:hypothetical protein